jgi:hypothetical protein
MKHRRALHADLNRLVAATAMYARQQSERMAFGDEPEYEDVTEETHDLVHNVLNRIEQSLDEDFVESLERGEYQKPFWPWDGWPRAPWFALRPARLARPSTAVRGREEVMLQEILEDFRANVQTKLRKARRDERSLTDAEIDKLLADLREDLKLVARRAERREERRRIDENHED